MPGAPQPDASAWERRAQMRGWGKTDTEEGKKGTEREREGEKEREREGRMRESEGEREVGVRGPEKATDSRVRERVWRGRVCRE